MIDKEALMRTIKLMDSRDVSSSFINMDAMIRSSVPTAWLRTQSGVARLRRWKTRWWWRLPFAARIARKLAR